MGYVIGGAKRTDIYTHSNITTPTMGTTAVFQTDHTISTDVAKDDSGNYTVTYDQIKDDAATTAFLEAYTSVAAAGGEDILFEDASELKGAASGNSDLIAIIYGGIDATATTPPRKMFAVSCKLSNASGGWKQEGKKYSRPTMVLIGQDLKGQLVIPATTIATSLVTTPTAITLSTTYKKGRVVWM